MCTSRKRRRKPAKETKRRQQVEEEEDAETWYPDGFREEGDELLHIM